MNILVILKMTPDVVEELEIAADGRSLDAGLLRMAVSEGDEHALEEALLIKERHGGRVTVLAVEAPDVDDALFAALAKGADRAVRISGAGLGLGTRAVARVLASVLTDAHRLLPVDLVLTGTQAIDDLDGLLAPLVAHHLGMPYLGIVAEVAPDPARRTVTVVKEYPGGVRGRFEIDLPAVIGIQSAEKPPRYVPVAKVRAAMKSERIDSALVPSLADTTGPLIEVIEMRKPEAAGRAEMIEGPPAQVADKICEVLAARGLL